MLALRRTAMGGDARIRGTSPEARASIARARRVAHPKTSPGFTLLELMITLSVLAILASLGVPAMQDMLERNRLKSAAQALAEDLQWLRGEAIRRNRDLHLVFDDGTPWCYGITERTDCDCQLTDPNAGDACTLSPPTADAVPLMKRVGSADLGRISATTTLSQGLTGFEPRRGTTIRMGSGAAGSELNGNGNVTFSTPNGDQLRIILSVLGRVRLCSPNQSVPGFRECD
ncbi:GspH/FimT family pseudopilin [Thiocapsa sp.]|uniref:GspH/FimT family pseudopilin n=1 Tax=Thiocapsa sp. TaxID=2024551 RepID=UPI002C380026|nr:GspH/FimT family pseudopilin [Thiocapsa sp.]HSO83286.1 GspH/FimT family pseudopilin [Thiocapsa sp.]